jgi:antitoxin FitA
MGDLLIRNIAEALKADLERLAKETGQSLSETAKVALGEGVKVARKRQVSDRGKLPLGQRLRAIFEGTFESDSEADDFHRYLEEQRKKSVARPLPDFK